MYERQAEIKRCNFRFAVARVSKPPSDLFTILPKSVSKGIKKVLVVHADFHLECARVLPKDGTLSATARSAHPGTEWSSQLPVRKLGLEDECTVEQAVWMCCASSDTLYMWFPLATLR